MENEKQEKNYEIYSRSLPKFIGEEPALKIISEMGDSLKKGSFSTTSDTGSAYDGSLIENIFEISSIAKKINKTLPESIQADEDSIVKVAFLSHISKAIWFTENDNSWEKTNRGILYKFNDLKGALRCGERSILISMNMGVKFTPEEFEAMRIIDKSDDDKYAKTQSSVLSTVIKQANELVTLKNKLKA